MCGEVKIGERGIHMILEEEVLVGLGGSNIKHYESLGYKIPRVINKYGKLIVEHGTTILVKVDDLPCGDVEVTKVCDECGKHIPDQPIFSILTSRKNGDGKDRCDKCKGKPISIKLKSNVKYEKTLEYYAKANNKEYLLEEFSNKNIKKPNEISYGTSEKFLWNCFKCKSEYPMSLSKRTNMNCKCPFCRGSRVNYTNSLFAKNPSIAVLLTDQSLGHKLTSGSNKKVDFTCPDCGHIDNKQVSSVVKNGFSCTRCSDTLTYPEKFMIGVLEQIGIEFETQKKFSWSKNKRYDFYIPSMNSLIETHGAQHYIFTGFYKNSQQDEQRNDAIKEKLAKDVGGIENYYVIDCRESDKDFIKNSIISSQLARNINLDKVDWEKCNEFASSNFLKIISDIWNNGNITASEIGKLVRLERGTVVRYLKRATELGWCEYDPKIAQRNSGLRSGYLGKRQVVQLSINNEFIKEWDCAKNAQRILGIFNIAAVCKGKQERAGGFRWLYKEDYEILLKTN